MLRNCCSNSPHAFKLYDDRLGVTSEDTGYLGVADFPGDDGSTAVSDVVVFNAEYGADAQATEPGSYYYLTYIHELGHAMGLAHPHNGGSFGWNGYESALFPGVGEGAESSGGDFDNNSTPWTVMTYNELRRISPSQMQADRPIMSRPVWNPMTATSKI